MACFRSSQNASCCICPHLNDRKSDAVQRKAAYGIADLRDGVLCCSVYVPSLSWGTETWNTKTNSVILRSSNEMNKMEV